MGANRHASAVGRDRNAGRPGRARNAGRPVRGRNAGRPVRAPETQAAAGATEPQAAAGATETQAAVGATETQGRVAAEGYPSAAPTRSGLGDFHHPALPRRPCARSAGRRALHEFVFDLRPTCPRRRPQRYEPDLDSVDRLWCGTSTKRAVPRGTVSRRGNGNKHGATFRCQSTLGGGEEPRRNHRPGPWLPVISLKPVPTTAGGDTVLAPSGGGCGAMANHPPRRDCAEVHPRASVVSI